MPTRLFEMLLAQAGDPASSEVLALLKDGGYGIAALAIVGLCWLYRDNKIMSRELLGLATAQVQVNTRLQAQLEQLRAGLGD